AECQAGSANFRLRPRARAGADPHRRCGSKHPRRSAHRAVVPGRGPCAHGGCVVTRRRMLLGLLGANIMGSLSPPLFADAFAVAGIDGFYHLMDADRLRERRLPVLLDAVKATGFSGLNITYPFKQAVIPLLDAMDPEAMQVGAVNTVDIAPDGT